MSPSAEMSPVILILFAWAVIATGLFLRTLGIMHDWFYRTRVAHARRKRLQKVTDRLFARIALDSIEGAFLRGDLDQLNDEAKTRETIRLEAEANVLDLRQSVEALAFKLVEAQTRANELEIDEEETSRKISDLEMDLSAEKHRAVLLSADLEARRKELDQCRGETEIITLGRIAALDDRDRVIREREAAIAERDSARGSLAMANAALDRCVKAKRSIKKGKRS